MTARARPPDRRSPARDHPARRARLTLAPATASSVAIASRHSDTATSAPSTPRQPPHHRELNATLATAPAPDDDHDDGLASRGERQEKPGTSYTAAASRQTRTAHLSLSHAHAYDTAIQSPSRTSPTSERSGPDNTPSTSTAPGIAPPSANAPHNGSAGVSALQRSAQREPRSHRAADRRLLGVGGRDRRVDLKRSADSEWRRGRSRGSQRRCDPTRPTDQEIRSFDDGLDGSQPASTGWACRRAGKRSGLGDDRCVA